ncbi:hypothetical protein BC351_39035 [Paenibacillus ferrarius]|uniref:Uncharacterized protein n=1 Tax=Paenibacillus ferrarius TaxID=1469647 RepID=A0A1V4H9I4_9BACL|nr:hypothetical protein [Paenibacillus ferrarius]OPH47985.1 hypothetical protein BC351_39035 [Paenibacillus ferrarius]
MEQVVDVEYKRITFTKNHVEINKDHFICSQFATAIDDNHFYISQYRDINAKYPKGFIVNRNSQIIWSTLELEKRYTIISSNVTYDKNVLLYVKNEPYDLIELSLNGQIVNTYNMKIHGVKSMYFYYKTKQNTILLSSIQDGRILELSETNEVLFEYCPGKEILSEPRCVFPTESGHFLIADSKHHYIMMINRNKEMIWSYGEKNNPGFAPGRLMYPYMALELPSGHILIAEHQANRITEVSLNREIVWQYGNNPVDETTSPRKNYLNGPNFAQMLPNGELVISDSMNGRILVIDRNYAIHFKYGLTPKDYHILNFPRSVQLLKNGRFLIADSRNDRIVEMDRTGEIYFEYGNEAVFANRTLKWPRCVYKDEKRNHYLISDGFNQRFIIIDQNKKVLNEIKSITYQTEAIPLRDPHSVESLLDDKLLITDSGSNIVCIIDRNGQVNWMYSNEQFPLDDPHYATVSRGNSIYIVDTNHSRLIEVDLSTNTVLNVIDAVYTKDHRKIKLNKPKWIDLISENELAILDSQNNYLMVVNISDKAHPVIEQMTDPTICNSRWAYRQDQAYYISDFWQHDLIQVTFSR